MVRLHLVCWPVGTYGMRAVLVWSLKVYHAIEASIGRAVALVAMLVELFLGEDVATSLDR